MAEFRHGGGDSLISPWLIPFEWDGRDWLIILSRLQGSDTIHGVTIVTSPLLCVRANQLSGYVHSNTLCKSEAPKLKQSFEAVPDALGSTAA